MTCKSVCQVAVTGMLNQACFLNVEDNANSPTNAPVCQRFPTSRRGDKSERPRCFFFSSSGSHCVLFSLFCSVICQIFSIALAQEELVENGSEQHVRFVLHCEVVYAGPLPRSRWQSKQTDRGFLSLTLSLSPQLFDQIQTRSDGQIKLYVVIFLI